MASASRPTISSSLRMAIPSVARCLSTLQVTDGLRKPAPDCDRSFRSRPMPVRRRAAGIDEDARYVASYSVASATHKKAPAEAGALELSKRREEISTRTQYLATTGPPQLKR